MPYEWVGFRIDPPIREILGKTPDDIKLINVSGAIAELQVKIGEDRSEKIKKSENFKKLLEDSEKKLVAQNPSKTLDTTEKSKNLINHLEQEIRNYATQKANNFINQLNFKLDSATYSIQFKELAILQFKREISLGINAYVKGNYVTDIFEMDGEDNVSNRVLNSYANGLKALRNGDFISAYYYFYLVFPEKHEITNNPQLNLDLKILRDGASHNVLENQKLQDRAKELIGDDFVKPDKKNTKNTYAYIDKTNPRHIDLFKSHIPIVKENARDYINKSVKSNV